MAQASCRSVQRKGQGEGRLLSKIGWGLIDMRDHEPPLLLCSVTLKKEACQAVGPTTPHGRPPGKLEGGSCALLCLWVPNGNDDVNAAPQQKYWVRGNGFMRWQETPARD
ncbi:hypothetical protein BaRGS_00004317 [Batillaria attramentaria]|uniref:Uncharacterized protein n=1 Tax=Batillaria attramentaria TaxID=370345 RepID=A0ABD0LZ69_9CAEN